MRTDAEDSRSLDDCHPRLKERYLDLEARYFKETGHHLFITCTYRSPKKQYELYCQGRSKPGKIVTNCDGHKYRSRHNAYPAEAIDVCVNSGTTDTKVADWDPRVYKPLGDICEKVGLVWGGNWTFHDYPHIEMLSS